MAEGRPISVTPPRMGLPDDISHARAFRPIWPEDSGNYLGCGPPAGCSTPCPVLRPGPYRLPTDRSSVIQERTTLATVSSAERSTDL